jgi:hypothetical protein
MERRVSGIGGRWLRTGAERTPNAAAQAAWSRRASRASLGFFGGGAPRDTNRANAVEEPAAVDRSRNGA